jgi:alkylhydroperoxidase/carboxymuconolactone decarboxylase family protein YurZ
VTMTLTDSDRRLVRLFTACVLGRWDEVRAVRAAARGAEPDRRWREAVLQVHVFAGFPRLVEAYGVFETCGGLGAFDPNEPGEPDEPGEIGQIGTAVDAAARGAQLFETIYGSGADEVRAMLARHHPDFARWILEHAYGRVLARAGLSADRRELLAVAALAALGQDRQLASHARGAVRCGASVGEVHAVLECLRGLVPDERIEAARRVVEKFAAS